MEVKAVKALLGEAVDDILNSAINGDFSDNQMNTVVLLDDTLYCEDDEPYVLQNKHKQRMERDWDRCNEYEMKCILSDFYSWGYCDKTKEEWLSILIGVFYHPDVNMIPLAQKLETHMPNQGAYAQEKAGGSVGPGGAVGTVGRGDDGGLEAGVEAEVVKEVMPS